MTKTARSRGRVETATASPTPSLADAASLSDVRRFLKIRKDEWDAFIITDGSGTTLEHSIGFAAVTIDKEDVEPRIDFGSNSRGTNNTAELAAVMWALSYLVEQKKGVREHGYRVHVLSDSSYVVQGLNRSILKWLPDMKKHRMLWMSILGAQRSGLVIKGHLIPRDTLDLNKICHDVANLARVQAKRLVETCQQMDISDFAP